MNSDSQALIEESLASICFASICIRDRNSLNESAVLKASEVFYRAKDFANAAHKLAKDQANRPTVALPGAIMMLSVIKEVDAILRSDETVASLATQVGL